MRSALGLSQTMKIFQSSPKRRESCWMEDARAHRVSGKNWCPPLIKTQTKTFTGLKSKYSSCFLLFDKWPAIVPESTTQSHSALLEGDHGIATSTERIQGMCLHAGLYGHGHDSTVMTRENLWIILNTFKCASKPTLSLGQVGGGGRQRKILMHIYFSPTYYFVFLCLWNQVILATMSVQG